MTEHLWLVARFQESLDGSGEPPWVVHMETRPGSVTRAELEGILGELQDPARTWVRSLADMPQMILVFDRQPDLDGLTAANLNGVSIGHDNFGLVEIIDLIVSQKSLS